MRAAARCVATLLVLALSQAAEAEALSGRVVGVTDGDTLTVLVDRQEVRSG